MQIIWLPPRVQVSTRIFPPPKFWWKNSNVVKKSRPRVVQQRVVGRSPSKLYQKVRFEHYALSSASTIAMSAAERLEKRVRRGKKPCVNWKKKRVKGLSTICNFDTTQKRLCYKKRLSNDGLTTHACKMKCNQERGGDFLICILKWCLTRASDNPLELYYIMLERDASQENPLERVSREK